MNKPFIQVLTVLVTMAVLLVGTSLFAQNSITLTFTGQNQHNTYVRLEKVTIQNLTRDWSEDIFFPDTIYTLVVSTGIRDYADKEMMQVMPNPFDGKTQLNIFSAKGEYAKLELVDVTGKKCAEYEGNLSQGNNCFELSLIIPQTYILTVRTSAGVHSVKMVNTGRAGTNQLVPVGNDDGMTRVNLKSSKSHYFELGDEMCYTGYCQQGEDILTSTAVTQNQYESEFIVLDFNTCEIPQLVITGNTSIMYGDNTTLTVAGAETYVWNTGETTSSIIVAPTATTTYTVTGTNGNVCTATTSCTVNVQAILPIVTTDSVTAISHNSAICGGNVSFDGGAPVTARGVCWSTSPLPTISDAHTTDGTGLGAFTSTLIGLMHSTYYYVRAYATNSEGTVYGDEIMFVTETPIYGQPCPGLGTVTDYDNNVYNTVLLGNQCWMAENLRTTHFSDGTAITYVSNNTNSMTIPYCYAPLWDASYIPTFSYLYNWAAVMHGASSSNNNPSGVQGICPVGWHVPSNAEWNQLTDYVGSRSEYTCGGQSSNIAKALASRTEWGLGTTDCAVGNDQLFNNLTGFSALPAGGYFNLGYMTFYDAGFWSSTFIGGSQAYFAHINRNSSSLDMDMCDALNGFSVRCVCDSVFVVGQPCPGVETVIDYDGNEYSTVQIGTQCWMKENLRTTHYADGTIIPAGTTNSNTVAYHYAPDNNENNVSEYGYLYNWPAVVRGTAPYNENIPSGVQGVCPTGWHVPSDAEWVSMLNYISYQNEYFCGGQSTNNGKALAATMGWNTSTNQCAVGNDQILNNATGFSAQPAGTFYNNYYTHNVYQEFGSVAYFWTCTNDWDLVSYGYKLSFNDNQIHSSESYKSCGFSVRCVLDPVIINTDTANGQPCPGTPTLTDYDGNVYRTVQIGSQCWMAENLRTTHYADGEYIPYDSTSYGDTYLPYRYITNDYEPYVPVYGYLYNRRAVVRGASSSNSNPSGVQGICPNGWHVPSNAEWVQLGNYVNSQSGYACSSNGSNYNAKAMASKMGWNVSAGSCHAGNDPSTNNATGLSVLPAGCYSGRTFEFGKEARFWTATNNSSSTMSYYYYLIYNYASIGYTIDFQAEGYSVRCVRN